MNLCNEKNKMAGNGYFCTWVSQSLARSEEQQKSGKPQERDFLTEEFVFGKDGVINVLPEVRKNLIFVFDDGWDVGYGLHMGHNRDMFGSLIVNEKRFPFCTGTPTERLKKLNAAVMAEGWGGTGLWVCANGVGEKSGSMFSEKQRVEYWSERLKWSAEAGIKYWKVDWGHYELDISFRKMLTDLGKKIAPELVIEHAGCCQPMNGIEAGNENAPCSGRFADWGGRAEKWRTITAFSDVFRSYDVTPHLSIPTTLDRLCGLMDNFEANNKNNCIINCEDEMYIGAVFGCNLGIMRSSICHPLNNNLSDPAFSHKRIAEVIRAVRWQTCFAASKTLSEQKLKISDEVLFDYHDFSDDLCSWAGYGKRLLSQGAPAIMALNTELPKVKALEKLVPYVIACRSNDTIAVAALPRVYGQYEIKTPKAEISINVPNADLSIGVFGNISMLKLIFDCNIEGKGVYMQDLISDTADDITDIVKPSGRELIINGDLLKKCCNKNQSPDDYSEPGAVIKLI